MTTDAFVSTGMMNGSNMMNGGKDPYFNHTGILVYDGEPGLESAMCRLQKYVYTQYADSFVLGVMSARGLWPKEFVYEMSSKMTDWVKECGKYITYRTYQS